MYTSSTGRAPHTPSASLSPHFQCSQKQTPASRSLSPSLKYFKHLQHISISLYALQARAYHHTLLPLPLPLSLTRFKHFQRTFLSLYVLQALNKPPHPSSRSPSLSLTYLEHLQHISLSLAVYIYICIYQAMTTHHTLLSLPLALSNIFRALTAHLSLSLSLYIY